MKWLMYAIWDRKALTYSMPYSFRAPGEAIRAFADEANNPQSRLCKHAEDFDLVKIGVYCDETADYEVVRPEALGNLGQWRQYPGEQFPHSGMLTPLEQVIGNESTEERKVANGEG